jgi:hypothetical protein
MWDIGVMNERGDVNDTCGVFLLIAHVEDDTVTNVGKSYLKISY